MHGYATLKRSYAHGNNSNGIAVTRFIKYNAKILFYIYNITETQRLRYAQTGSGVINANANIMKFSELCIHNKTRTPHLVRPPEYVANANLLGRT